MGRISVSLVSQFWASAPYVLLLLGAAFAWRGIALLRRLVRAHKHDDAPFWLVRGLRGIIVAISCLSIAAGLAYKMNGILWFGVAFLGEEIYETGMILLILRWHRSRTQRSATGLRAG